MSEIKELKPFRQMAHYEPTDKLSITGEEFEAIQEVLSIFTAPLNAIQSIFDRNINEGNIVIKYIQQDGTEITKEEAEEFIKKATKFIKNKEKIPN